MAKRPRIRDAIHAAAAGEAPPVVGRERKLEPAHTTWPAGRLADIMVLGAGAAGLASAIFAAEQAPDASIVVLEGSAHLGTKILVSGGTRCNVTHDHVAASDFAGPRPLIQRVFRAFGQQETVWWMESMGVALDREETGKLFPSTDTAVTVLNALLRRCNELGVIILRSHRVDAVERQPDGQFRLRATQGGTLLCRRLIMATGGRSLPKSGSDGAGWDMLQAMGHTVTPSYPALVPLILQDRFMHGELSGLTHEIALRVEAAGETLAEVRDSLLWTHFGISGPAAMNISRYLLVAQAEAKAAGRPAPRLLASLAPDHDAASLDRHLIALAGSGRLATAAALSQLMPQRLAALLCQRLGLDPSLLLSQLRREQRQELVAAICHCELPVVGPRGWNYAEVTAGGVPLGEIDTKDMQSKQIPGLHLVGELIDVDGPIGGYNFQWAWSTGYVGGSGAAAALGA